jgi:uncharacterized protein YecT (DUF1311 family)
MKKLLMIGAIASSLLLSIESASAESNSTACRGLTGAAMPLCSVKQYEVAEQELDRIYQQHLGGISTGEKQVLTAAQTAWQTYRDQGCAFEVYASRGGSAYGSFITACQLRVTKARTAELRRLWSDRHKVYHNGLSISM